MLPVELAKTLETAAIALNFRHRDWVVFGGAAMVLHGFNIGYIEDIDIIVSGETAADLMVELSLENQADGGSETFRSEFLLRPNFGPTEVEILGNFEIRSGTIWNRIVPRKRVAFSAGSQTIFAPEITELADIFDLCGRTKDLARSRFIRSR